MPFVDEVTVRLQAGKGGDGCLSFRREKFIPKGGPDGGDGGNGGSVILRCDENTSDLSAYLYEPEWKAPHGQGGMGAKCAGRDGKDVVLKVPEGTEVYDTLSGKKVADLTQNGTEVRLLRGGRGGLGNVHFKSSINRAPRKITPGKPGESGTFRLELKSIADVGLVGFPNAGKSTLINALTNAQSKVAAYPFTTLNPQLGRMKSGGKKIVIADIPGIIEDAHRDKGLGLKFLKHIERCKLLLILVDAAGSDGRDPKKDYKALIKELEAYSEEMLKKPRIVVANKIDLLQKRPALGLSKSKETVMWISCATLEGVEALAKLLQETFENA